MQFLNSTTRNTVDSLNPQINLTLRFSILTVHAEVRQEAVQQALAALKNRPKPSLPMPSKRSSVLNRSPDRGGDDDDDDDSGVYLYPLIIIYQIRAAFLIASNGNFN